MDTALTELVLSVLAGAAPPEDVADYLRSPRACDAAWLELQRGLGLSIAEVAAAVLASTAELSVSNGRRIAKLQEPLGGSRPLVGMVSAVWKTPAEELAGGQAIATGLLRLTGESAPLVERAFAMTPHCAAAFAGRDLAPPGAFIGLPAASEVPLPPSFRADVARYAAAAGAGVVIRGGTPSEGRAAAAALAEALRLRPAFLSREDISGIGPWLRLRRLLPVYELLLGPGERKSIVAPLGYDGPLVILASRDGSVDVGSGALLDWTLGIPNADDREWCWRAAGFGPALAPRLARDHRHGPGRIAQLASIASRLDALAPGESSPQQRLARAAWSVEREGMPSLAMPMQDEIPEDAFVAPPALREDLDALLARCRTREGLAANLGIAAGVRYRPGVRALFSGPSGTGKTLAAGWLATTLRMPLFRVDLAAVTSKYIGETEKNLAQLMARAEHEEIILLFDEADALFARRTDIRDAHDRHANAQTNYLLQRIEEFDGIAILTTNSQTRIDQAFARRLDAILEFSRPAPAERRELWLKHLGAGHLLHTREVNTLAARVDFTGGDIRNAVLYAAVRAQSEDRPIAWDDVVRGVQAEYRKLGMQSPVELAALAS